jgi:CRISPR-associated protein Csb2
LKVLQQSFERFQKIPIKVNRPGRGTTALYAAPSTVNIPAAARGLFREVVVFRRVTGERIYLPGSLAVTTALRNALMASGPQPPPESISGHASESTPDNPVRSGRPHVALAPLPFVGPPRGSGEILGVAALLPASFSDDERRIVLRALATVRALRMPSGTWAIERSDAEESRRTLQPHLWTYPSRTWATVTPYVFDRYPGEPYGQKAQETVRLSFERVGLPRPVSVSLMKTSVHFGAPPAQAFPAAAVRAGKPKRFHIHALVTFDQPVAGPVVAGAGRFYGYGLFRPLLEER